MHCHYSKTGSAAHCMSTVIRQDSLTARSVLGSFIRNILELLRLDVSSGISKRWLNGRLLYKKQVCTFSKYKAAVERWTACSILLQCVEFLARRIRKHPVINEIKVLKRSGILNTAIFKCHSLYVERAMRLWSETFPPWYNRYSWPCVKKQSPS